jgi:hypothetical protein
MIRVIFKDVDNDTELGSTLYADIIETSIPSFHQTSHDMYLTKKFANEKHPIGKQEFKGLIEQGRGGSNRLTFTNEFLPNPDCCARTQHSI